MPDIKNWIKGTIFDFEGKFIFCSNGVNGSTVRTRGLLFLLVIYALGY